MFGLYMLAIYLGIAIIAAGFVACSSSSRLRWDWSRIPSHARLGIPQARRPCRRPGADFSR